MPKDYVVRVIPESSPIMMTCNMTLIDAQNLVNRLNHTLSTQPSWDDNYTIQLVDTVEAITLDEYYIEDGLVTGQIPV